MPETIKLSTMGPHSPDYTRELGNALAETVRVLNYATNGAPGGGLEYPGDVYTLLGALYTATERLPQLFGQLALFLKRERASGRLSDDHGRDPAIQAGMAEDLLEDIARRMPAITVHLQRAQNDISGLYVKDGDDGV